MTAPLVTFVGVAHPWMCDAMGLVNVRYYAAMFNDASFQLLGHIAGDAKAEAAGEGWADVRCAIEYKRETRDASPSRSHPPFAAARKGWWQAKAKSPGALDWGG